MTHADKTVAEIAFLKLNIETLDASGSDSFDTHNVNVSNLRSALLSAYEAGRTATNCKRLAKYPQDGTCYRATIEASYQDLVETWGEPAKGDEYKTEAEWVIRPTRNEVITIYNYKNSRAYGNKYPEITEVREWHVGGHSGDVVDRLLKMMSGRARLIHRVE